MTGFAMRWRPGTGTYNFDGPKKTKGPSARRDLAKALVARTVWLRGSDAAKAKRGLTSGEILGYFARARVGGHL